MKTRIPLFAFSLALSLGSQAGSIDLHSLAKYTYPIFVVAGKQQFTSTAFFFQSGDTTFLVSNYHAIKGMSPLKQSINFITDSLYLKYRVKDSHDFKIMTIDISEENTGKTEIFSMTDRIDLLKVKVDLPNDAEIFYINDLIDPDYIDAEPEEIISFGFPTKTGNVAAFASRQQRLQGVVNPTGYLDYAASLEDKFPRASDSAKAVMQATARYYYFIKPYAPQGYSGAPVFGKFRTADNQIVYRFIGVIFAGQPTTKQTWVIKAPVALEYLQR